MNWSLARIPSGVRRWSVPANDPALEKVLNSRRLWRFVLENTKNLRACHGSEAKYFPESSPGSRQTQFRKAFSEKEVTIHTFGCCTSAKARIHDVHVDLRPL